MIREFWDYVTTPASEKARKEGYLYNSISLAHRARRARQAWQPHLENCHIEIARVLTEVNPRRVCILGSGLLLETPPALFDRQLQVDCVDIVHTKDVRLMTLPKQFRLIEMDLSQKLPSQEYDLYLSANLLSQLPLTQPADQAEKIQSQHIRLLNQFPQKVLLWSDFMMEIFDKKGQRIETHTTVDPDLHLSWKKFWKWTVAPRGEADQDRQIILTVGITQNLPLG